MKNILLIMACAYSLTAIAQSTDSSKPIPQSSPDMNTVQVNTTPAIITLDTQPGRLSALIPQANLKDVQKDWARYVGNGSKGKGAMANGQYSQYMAVNKNISPDPFNITARLLGTINGVRITVWLSDNNNFENSRTPGSDRDLALQKYVRDFAVTEYRQAVMNEYTAASDKEKGMENDLTKQIREEENAAKSTEQSKREIAKARDAIATNDRDITSITGKIESQKGMVDNTAADPNATKGAKKTLNELENDKTNLQKQNDKEGKNIEKWGNEIRANDKFIADAREKETSKKSDIEKQKKNLQTIKANMDDIR